MSLERYRADLHYHGPIGFEPYWLRVQGYRSKNLLKEIADAGFNKGLNVLALTSVTHQTDDKGVIVRNSIHDRIGYLAENYLSDLNKTKGYSADKLGPNSLVVDNGKNRLYLISGQTSIVKEGDKRLDYLVVGSNSVPNFMNLRDTQKYCMDNGLLHGLEHPNLEVHFGIGLEMAKDYVEKADFVETHNAQLMWPGFMKGLPKVGKYTRINNEKAKNFAYVYNKPGIATSDGHMIESAGAAYIEFGKVLLDTDKEDKLLETLSSVVCLNHFNAFEGYDSPINWLEWVSKFNWGIRKERYKEE